MDGSAHSPPDAPGREGLKDAAIRGMRWSLLARAAGEVLTLGAAVTLARLVPPDEFGRAAVPLAIVPLAVIMTFEGCASALVQRKQVDVEHERTAVAMSLCAGALLSALLFALARPVGGAVFGDRVAGLLEMVSPVFLVASLGAVPRAILWRRLDFRHVSVAEVAGLFAGATTAVSLALTGMDAEAVVLGALANTAVNSLLLAAWAPPRLGHARGRAVRDIAGFGTPAALAGLVHVGFTNAGVLVVAARLSATQAGLYWRAFQLGVVYQDKLSGVMLRLAFPVYSRTGSAEEMRELHARATRLHATVLLPLLGVLIVTAPVLVPFVFGEVWAGAALPAQILAVAGMATAVLTGYPQVMLAVGRPAALLRFNVAVLAVYTAVVVVVAPLGLTAVCIAVSCLHVLILVAVYGLLLRRHAGVPMRRAILDTYPALAGCVALLATGFALRGALEAAGMPAPVLIVAVSAAGLAAYACTIRQLFPLAWHDATTIARRLVPRRERAPRAAPALSQGATS